MWLPVIHQFGNIESPGEGAAEHACGDYMDCGLIEVERPSHFKQDFFSGQR